MQDAHGVGILEPMDGSLWNWTWKHFIVTVDKFASAKRHPDLIGRFSTIHWTDTQTDRRPRECLITIVRSAAA